MVIYGFTVRSCHRSEGLFSFRPMPPACFRALIAGRWKNRTDITTPATRRGTL